jgi:F-type H+-transporting ATPase subunit b
MNYRASEHLIPIFDYGVLHLELNTALFILVLFLVVMFALNWLLFKPVLRTLDGRAALLAGIQTDNARKEQEIAKLTREYETRMAQIRDEIDRLRQDSRRESAKAAEGIVSAARQAAEQKMSSVLAELQREVARVRAEALAGAKSLAAEITRRVLPS